MGFSLVLLLIVIVVVVVLLIGGMKLIKDHERGVVLRMGRVQGEPRGPGLVMLVPFVDSILKVDLRTATMDVSVRDVLTRDEVGVRADAIVRYRVVDPKKSVIETENHALATNQVSQTVLRQIIVQTDLDELLGGRARINEELRDAIDQGTRLWGVEVGEVEIREVRVMH